MSIAVEILCPYCRVISEHFIESEINNLGEVVICSNEEGDKGCGNKFVITWEIRVDIAVEKIAGQN
jgi:hypothetical protein